MSLPIVFKPVVIRDVHMSSVGNGPAPSGRLIPNKNLEGTWVDGGVLNNLPITAFDDEPGRNPKTFGVRLGVDKEPKRIKSLLDLVVAYVGLVATGTGEVHQSTSLGTFGRSVQLELKGLGLINFAPDAPTRKLNSDLASQRTVDYFNPLKT